MVSPIRDAAINGMVEELLAPPPKAQFTIKKKVERRRERRRELEFVPKARFEDWDQERLDDL